MTVQIHPYIRAKNREYSYSLVRPRLRRFSKRSVLPYFESGVLASLSGIEDRLLLSWMRQKAEKEVYKRILSQSIAIRENLPHSYNPIADWFQISEQVIKRPSVNVSYDNKDSVFTLLGTKGKIVLNKVINLIQKEAEEDNWPLAKIEVQYRKDADVQDWEYVVIALAYDSSFEDVDKYLNILYNRLDEEADRLNSDEKAILAELIYIDIRTNNEISSS